jgi:hypothetical protein
MGPEPAHLWKSHAGGPKAEIRLSIENQASGSKSARRTIHSRKAAKNFSTASGEAILTYHYGTIALARMDLDDEKLHLSN